MTEKRTRKREAAAIASYMKWVGQGMANLPTKGKIASRNNFRKSQLPPRPMPTLTITRRYTNHALERTRMRGVVKPEFSD